MNMLQWENRWIYKGSYTVPPCEQYVYWNVISKVYPISQLHLDLFRQKLDGIYDGLGTSGNTRVIQRGFNKDVAFVTAGAAMLGGAVMGAVGMLASMW